MGGGAPDGHGRRRDRRADGREAKSSRFEGPAARDGTINAPMAGCELRFRREKTLPTTAADPRRGAGRGARGSRQGGRVRPTARTPMQWFLTSTYGQGRRRAAQEAAEIVGFYLRKNGASRTSAPGPEIRVAVVEFLTVPHRRPFCKNARSRSSPSACYRCTRTDTSCSSAAPGFPVRRDYQDSKNW